MTTAPSCFHSPAAYVLSPGLGRAEMYFWYYLSYSFWEKTQGNYLCLRITAFLRTFGSYSNIVIGDVL